MQAVIGRTVLPNGHSSADSDIAPRDTIEMPENTSASSVVGDCD